MVLNHYPLWKNILLILAIVCGIIYAAPNLYGDDPALQIQALRGGQINQELILHVEQALDQAKLPYQHVEQQTSGLLVRFAQGDAQLQGQAVLKQALGDDYVVALNLAPATPQWLRALGAHPMKLGLDLRGGVHFLMEVDIDSAINQRLESYLGELRTRLRQEQIRYQDISVSRQDEVVIRLSNKDGVEPAEKFLSENFPDLSFKTDPQSDTTLKGAFTVSELKNIHDYVMEQSMTTLRNRVNELGVAEAVVQRQGTNRVMVQLPGVQDTARAKDIIGKTATLEFLLVDDSVDPRLVMQGQVPFGSKMVTDRDGRSWLFKKRVILSGDNIVGANSGSDEYGRPDVQVRVGGNSGLFSQITRDNVGKQMGAIFIETHYDDVMIGGEKKRIKRTTEEAISIATIQSALGNRFQITGIGNVEEARNLALLLRAGALPASIDFIEERTVGPSLGMENIEMGVRSVIVGLVMVLVFMAVYYHLFGLFANISLIVNLILLVAVLSIIGATLTLPGIAGIVLTLGMAVDGNVLIDERIREELRNGSTPQASIHAGYERALVTIMDANITTFIAALVLFSIGTGPVKGFAVTLSVGLVTSVFTGVMVSRALVNYWYGGKTVKKLSIGM